MLIISTIKEVPSTKALSIVRAIYLIPGIVCAAILAGSGVNIDITTVSTTIHNVNTTETWTQSDNTSIVLLNPVWILVHGMIFVVLTIYVILQMLTLLTKHDPRGAK